MKLLCACAAVLAILAAPARAQAPAAAPPTEAEIEQAWAICQPHWKATARYSFAWEPGWEKCEQLRPLYDASRPGILARQAAEAEARRNSMLDDVIKRSQKK